MSANQKRSWRKLDGLLMAGSCPADAQAQGPVTTVSATLERLGDFSIDLDRPRSIEPYSHSIINERSKLLIHIAPHENSAIFTVIFTVIL